MKFLRFYILYRLQIIIALVILGILAHLYLDPVTAWICYILAIFSLVFYFGMGTMRLVQEAVTEGDVDKAMMYLNKIKFPRLLYKPIRSGYYMLQSNLSMASNDLNKAEESIRKSLKIKSKIVGDMEGANLMQLGFIELKKGNTKQARTHLMEAIKAGIPDKDSLAATHLQLCNIEAQRMQYKIAKQHFKKAKDLKPKNEEIVSQLKSLEKQIARMPG
ncbi:MAG: tetratricopeptide repeat protein [Bacteroidia bacterium]|nr:tetratricopeptide repeat protein [Bacteroidia bacterium]